MHARLELAKLRGAGFARPRAGHQARPPGGLWLGPRVRAARAPTGAAPCRPCSESEIVRRVLHDPEPEGFDRLEQAVFTAILQTRRLLHVHSERIFLVGCGEGAAVAYWLGLTFPERFAGVVAINGWLPVGLRPLGRLKACRELAHPGRARGLERQGPPP